MDTFLSRHGDAVIGTLCGFDRLVFRGTLRMLAHRGGMMTYLWAARVLLKDFAEHAREMTRRLKAASAALAGQHGRPVRYLASCATNQEEIARAIAKADGIEHGLICILTAVEPCLSYEIKRDRAARRLELLPRRRTCIYLYHYQIHPVLGFMHARIQTWFPFSIQICLNGREWLARAMDRVGYDRRDNCFVWLEDPARAQRRMDRQVRTAWPELLDGIAQSLNPAHDAMFRAFPVNCYWSTYQSESAGDILFRDPARLARLYPRLVQHGLTRFLRADVMRFLGRKIPASGRVPALLEADLVSDMKTRPEGGRIKHRLGDNAIKMYDKQASVLRVETTINDARAFKTFRAPEGEPEAPKRWLPMRKGIADLHRRAQISPEVPIGRQRTLLPSAGLGRGHHLSRPAHRPTVSTDQVPRPSGARRQPLRPRRCATAGGDQPRRVHGGRFAQSRSAPLAVRRRRRRKARAETQRRGGLSKTRAPARPSVEPKGGENTPLPSHQARPDHRHGPHNRTRRRHQSPNETSGLEKNRRGARRNWRLVVQRAQSRTSHDESPNPILQ